MSRFHSFALCIAASVWMACGGSSSGGGGWTSGGSTALRGTITGGSSSGSMDLSVSASRTALFVDMRDRAAGIGTVNVSGSARVNGTPLTLHGTFDTGTGAVLVKGDTATVPNAYTFTGNTVGDPATATTINGTWTGPGGAGGQFTVLFVPKSGSVTVYCGTFQGSASGTWNLVVGSDGRASGSFTTSSGSKKGALTGSVAGGTGTGTVSLSWGAGTSATGPITATTAGGCPSAGTWSDGTGGTGCWSGSSTGC
jgi:hypothetical protein